MNPNGLRKNYTPKQPEPAEQVKSCSTCGWKPNTFCLCQKFCDGFSQWKSKQPEPAAPVIRVCEQCGAVSHNSLVNICSSCGGGFVKPKEPKAVPGLVSYPIDGFERDWKVIFPNDWYRLYIAIGRKDFDHIECATGSIVYALQAFDPNDPPVRAYFRKV